MFHSFPTRRSSDLDVGSNVVASSSMASSATHSKCSKKAFFIMIQCCIIQKNTCFKLLFQNYMLTVRKSQTKVVPLLSTLLLFLALLLLMRSEEHTSELQS